MTRTTSRIRSTARVTATTGALFAASALVLTGCAAPAADDATELQLPNSGAAAACVELTPETFATADTAFRGTVDSIDGNQVTLAVDDVYAGDPGDQVVVPQQADLPSELSIGTLIEGETYLISSQGGIILTCGQSGAATPELDELYTAVY